MKIVLTPDGSSFRVVGLIPNADGCDNVAIYQASTTVVPEGGEYPTLGFLKRADAISLMDQLWREGVRPTNYEPPEAMGHCVELLKINVELARELAARAKCMAFTGAQIGSIE